MRWWCILFVTVLWRTATAKAVRELDNVSEASSTRQCCPCPEPGQTGRSAQGFGGGLRSLAYTDQEPFGATAGARTSLADVDDCPCRPRDADSAGASSMFFPTAMRAIRPIVSSLDDEKEDSKPLLHPEVNLASSVLETLRQATDEEYEDALARDAARSVAKAMEPDSIIQGVRNLIPVLVSQQQKHIEDDGEVVEASNIQNSRYAHPSLAKSNSNRSPSLKTQKFLSDILQKPSRKTSFNKEMNMDSDVGASNVNENMVPISQARFNKPKIDVPNILPQDNVFKNNRLSIPKLNDVLKNIEDSLGPKSRLTVNLDDAKMENQKALSKILNAIPILSSNKNGADKIDEVVNSDNTNAPSNLLENYSRFRDGRKIFSDKVMDVENNNNDAMSTLNNIKKKLLDIKIPDLKLVPENRDAASDLLTDIIKTLEESRKMLPLNLFNTQSKSTSTEGSETVNKEAKDIVFVPNDAKAFSTEIVDTVSSANAPKANAVECSTDAKGANKDDENVMLDPKIKTDVIDSIPSTTNVHEIMDANPDASEQNEVDSSEEPNISDNTSNGRFLNSDLDSKETHSDMDQDFEELPDDADDDLNDNFQSEKEHCSEDVDVAEADTNVSNLMVSKQGKDESVLDDVAPENFRVSSISSNSVTGNESKLIDDDESCENLKDQNDKLPLNSNHPSLSSKTVTNNEPKFTNEDDSYESSENLKNEKDKLLPHKGKALKRLESLKKPIKKLNQLSVTSDKKQKQLSIDDLQKMSNSLLDKEKILIKALAERNNKIENAESNKLEDIPTTSVKASDRNSKAKDASVAETNNVHQSTNKNENECLSDTPVKNREVGIGRKISNEMTHEASEAVGRALKPESLSRSSLLPNIVEPSSLFDGSTNLFNLPTVSLSDIFRNPLPPLRIPNIFGEMNNGMNRNNGGENDASSANKDSGMSSLASTSDSRSILAPFSPLEDLNLDILQLKPLGFAQSSSLPTLPRLNLNSYKTKLAIPKSLPLKPVFLESSVSNKKGIIGTSMSFGKDKKGILPKFDSKKSASDLLGIALPSFDDLQENFLENAQNLLSTPLETTGRNFIEDTFRSGHVLTENLKVQAKNVVNEFQKNIKLPLHESVPSSFLGNTLRSSDILDEISRKHEDLGDKLKGIHYDFSDRLETLRNDILDRIPSLGSPMSRQSSNLKARKQPLRASSKVNKNKSSTVRSRNLKKTEKPGKLKSLNMLSSPSVVSPKFAASPKSGSNSPVLPSLGLLPEDTNVAPPLSPRSRPLLDFFNKPASKQISNLRNSFFTPKLKENKVKITFETTPRPAAYSSTIRGQQRQKSKSFVPEESLSHNSQLKGKGNDLLPLKSVYDANDSPSKVKSVNTKAPLRVPIRSNPDTKLELKEAPSAIKSKPTPTTNRKSSVLNKSLEPVSLRAVDGVKRKTIGRPLVGDKGLKTGLPSLKSPSWPRIIDDNFLTNVREALKARLSGYAVKHRPISEFSTTAEPVSSDLARSASNAVEVVAPISDSLKENTSYSCQMLCTKIE